MQNKIEFHEFQQIAKGVLKTLTDYLDAHGLRSTSFGSNEGDKCPSGQVTAIIDNAQIQAQMCGLFD